MLVEQSQIYNSSEMTEIFSESLPGIFPGRDCLFFNMCNAVTTLKKWILS